jgi:capsular exopolysaccharide synthesis family protein
MPDQLLPLPPDGGGNTQIQLRQLASAPSMTPAPVITRSPIERPLAAVRRYKWLLLAIVVVATAAGYVATKLLKPTYEVRASITIQSDGPMESRTGPIRSAALLDANDWVQLLRSFAITDAVVRKLSLFLRPEVRSDIYIFNGFALGDSVAFGKYELRISRPTKRWTLLRQPSGIAVDSGGAADSVGHRVGFRYQIPNWVFNNGPNERKVRFLVETPRESSVRLIAKLTTQLQQNSNFLRLTFEDDDPQLAAQILNTWIDEYVAVAAQLKRRKLTDFANELESQLVTQKAALDSAERALQDFRVNTITLPSEGGPIAAGVQETRDPVIKDYFDKKIEYEKIRGDMSLLQTLMASVARDSMPSEALLQIRSTADAPVALQLKNAIALYHTVELDLETARAKYTDEHPIVKRDLTQLDELKNRKIPEYANALLKTLRLRAADDSARIADAGDNLKRIPQRTIEEERLRRARDQAASLFADLQSRSGNAQLAEKSATPDVTPLDTAVAPVAPTKNTAPRVMLMAIVGGIGAALALAILLDKIDGKIRYPDQVTDDLGMPIAGTVPAFPKGGIDHRSPEQMFQLVESFRTLRMAATNALGPRLALAVSSPSPGDGKSLISANLAMSFAESGLRTILIDGDTRRGSLHAMFGFGEAPGLTDYLSQSILLQDVIKPTTHASLSFMPRGTRRKRSPELLTLQRLPDMVDELRTMFDVVIFDTPPLAAGIDGYSISAATGALLVVLRTGLTNRRMAAEKLRLFERLPVDVIGAVLNGVTLNGAYSYYGYVAGYEAEDDPRVGSEVARIG